MPHLILHMERDRCWMEEEDRIIFVVPRTNIKDLRGGIPAYMCYKRNDLKQSEYRGLVVYLVSVQP